jgi:SAM-dependent methyltransferase
MSLGGFLGSVIINWIIPFISDRSIEYPLTLFFAALLLTYKKSAVFNKRALVHAAIYLVLLISLFYVIGQANMALFITFSAIGLLVMVPLIVTKDSYAHFRNLFGCGIIALIASPYLISDSTNLMFHRNFYGIYKIFDQDGKRHLMHGTTRHGTQYLADPEKQFLPLAYYHPTTPSGEMLKDNPMNVQDIGMIGLGSGALGAYLQEGQSMTIYELDADNVEIAEVHFNFLENGRNNGAKIDFVVGDGRLAIKSLEDATYDLFIVDAFSSDSVPVHLITIEVFQEYLRILKPNGILLMHCSNRYLDLLGLIQSNAEAMGVLFLFNENIGLENGDSLGSDWVVFSPSNDVLVTLSKKLNWKPYKSANALPDPWTDQYSSIIDMLK